MPVCIVATLVIAGLAYSTVGVAIRQEADRAEERWTRLRAERYGYRPEPVAVRAGHRGRHR